MARSLRLLGIVLSILILQRAVGSIASTLMEKKPMSHESTTIRGLDVRVELPASVTQAEPVLLTIAVVNNSADEAIVGETGYLPDCDISISDVSTGKRVPLSTLGINTVGEGPRNHAQFAYVKVPPGESRKWTTDLRKFFNLGSGAFKVAANIRIDRVQKSNAIVKVKEIRFAIQK